jgi:endonuclease YncB( thermonuclease family)
MRNTFVRSLDSNRRRPGSALVCLALLCTSLLLAVSVAVAEDREDGPIVGLATVTDGDGLKVAGETIRLFGIDAPETAQYCTRKDGSRWHCGQYSTVALDKLVKGKQVTCEIRTLDSYARWVSVCKVGDTDLSKYQVEQGWAVAYRRYSKDYVEAEDAARKEKRGIWSGEFAMPGDWRKGTRGR